jgi:hypothetical protein
MNKLLLFKKSSIALIATGLVVAGVASAAIVNFLSDYAEVVTTMVSPIEMSVNEDRDGNPSTLKSIDVDTTGGSHFTFTTVAENKANNIIDGYPVIVAVAPDGKEFTGGEIREVWFEDKNTPPAAGTGPFGNAAYNITNFLYVVYSDGTLHPLSTWTGNSKRLVLFFDNPSDPSNDDSIGIPDGIAQTYPIAASTVNWNVLTITPHQAIAPGTYNIYSQYANDLEEYATYQYGL